MSTLYHYCNPAAFVSIVQSRSLWLSSLTLSNDTMEGRLVNRVVMELAKKDGLEGYPLQRLEESVGVMEQMFDGLGFCLSEDGDLLSQWRGYADNASGLSIGFSQAYLEKLALVCKENKVPTSLQKVEYEPDAHRMQVAPTYEKLRKLIDAGAFKTVIRGLLDSRTDEEIKAEQQIIERANMTLALELLGLFPKLFLLKTYGFREEREWRLVSTLFKGLEVDCEYRATSGRIVPYRKFDLIDLGMPAIVEVLLGPKHPTPPRVVSAMLNRYGFDEVQVRRSEATYR